MSKPYQVLPPPAPVPAPDDVLERLVREGARKMLQDALEREVDDFLGRRVMNAQAPIVAIAMATCRHAQSVSARALSKSGCHALAMCRRGASDDRFHSEIVRATSADRIARRDS